MQLFIDFDAAYLVAPKARSRVAGFYYFKNTPQGTTQKPSNHPVFIVCHCLKHIVSSAAEAETAGLFYNSQHAILICRILQAMGHPQLPTQIKTDNITANGFVKKQYTSQKK